MPIHSCKLPGGGSGYQWGDHGKCYARRSQAEAQARAAYANGYREKYANAGGEGVYEAGQKMYTSPASATTGVATYALDGQRTRVRAKARERRTMARARARAATTNGG